MFLRDRQVQSSMAWFLASALSSRVHAAIWIPISDTSGVADSTGYIAGQAVLNPLIAAIRAYAAGKGWR